MNIGSTSVLIQSSVWRGTGIVSDIWNPEPEGIDEEKKIEEFTDYYLKQMNFLGNVLNG